MDDASSEHLLVKLTEVLDEMRETKELLPAAELSRTSQRRGWRKIVYGFARSRGEISAGFAMQYLTENTGRARDHWREALSTLDDVGRAGVDHEAIVRLMHDLDAAGSNGVLPRLRSDAIPYATAQAATHLSEVVSTIRDCEQLVAAARSRITLLRMRDQA
jgi:hypothetical protein